QARLQTTFGALSAAIVVGVLWGLWHLWPVIAPGGLSTTTWSDVVLTLVRLVSTSIVYAWLYNSTRGSLLIVMLAHAGHNLAVRFVPLANNVQHGDPVVTGLYALAAATLLVVTGHRWLSRIHEYPDSERISPEWSGGIGSSRPNIPSFAPSPQRRATQDAGIRGPPKAVGRGPNGGPLWCGAVERHPSLVVDPHRGPRGAWIAGRRPVARSAQPSRLMA